jgi:hypothetical protein
MFRPFLTSLFRGRIGGCNEGPAIRPEDAAQQRAAPAKERPQ